MSIKKRTQEDVIDYIKNHASNGKLQESLMNIGNTLGYSNATIHRVLKSLEEQGIIQVQVSEKPTKPNTIVYNGPIQQADDVMSEGLALMKELDDLKVRFASYIQESNRVIQGLKEQHTQPDTSLMSRITEVAEMPDGKHMMVIVRKENDDEVDVLRTFTGRPFMRSVIRQYEAHI